jgi:hypothetical protein
MRKMVKAEGGMGWKLKAQSSKLKANKVKAES